MAINTTAATTAIKKRSSPFTSILNRLLLLLIIGWTGLEPASGFLPSIIGRLLIHSATTQMFSKYTISTDDCQAIFQFLSKVKKPFETGIRFLWLVPSRHNRWCLYSTLPIRLILTHPRYLNSSDYHHTARL